MAGMQEEGTEQSLAVYRQQRKKKREAKKDKDESQSI